MLELLNQLDGFDSRGDVKVCYLLNELRWLKLKYSPYFFFLKHILETLSVLYNKLNMINVGGHGNQQNRDPGSCSDPARTN